MDEFDNEGCCGSPLKCAGQTNRGRCKAREDFERANEIKPEENRMERALREYFGEVGMAEILRQEENELKHERSQKRTHARRRL